MKSRTLVLTNSSVELGAVWAMVACRREGWFSATTFLVHKVKVV